MITDQGPHHTNKNVRLISMISIELKLLVVYCTCTMHHLHFTISFQKKKEQRKESQLSREKFCGKKNKRNWPSICVCCEQLVHHRSHHQHFSKCSEAINTWPKPQPNPTLSSTTTSPQPSNTNHTSQSSNWFSRFLLISWGGCPIYTLVWSFSLM